MTPEPGRHGLLVYMRSTILYPWMPPHLMAEDVDWVTVDIIKLMRVMTSRLAAF